MSHSPPAHDPPSSLSPPPAAAPRTGAENSPSLPANRSSAASPSAPTTHGHPLVTALVWLIVLAGLAVAVFFGWRYYTAADKADDAKAKRGDRPTPVLVDAATTGDFPIYLDNVGTVAAYNHVTIRTRIDGQLLKVNFSEGQLVKQGDVLFQIDPRPYEVQLAQAQGQLAQTQGQIAKDTATRDNAARDLKRLQAASEAVAQRDIDAAAAALANANGAIEADKGNLASNQAAIDSAKLNIAYCTITAPITGTIGLRIVDVGNMVHAGDSDGLAVITQLQPISVLFSPAQDTLSDVQKAMAREAAKEKRLPVEAWDATRERLLAAGQLEALDNQIDRSTATFKLKATFPNEDNALYPSQFVNVSLLLDTLKGVTLVPEAAVQQDAAGNHFVYVVTEIKADMEHEKGSGEGKSKRAGEGKPAEVAGPSPKAVEKRNVVIGDTRKDKTKDKQGITVIKSGLSPGELVVTDGLDKLQPNAKIIPHRAGEVAESQPASAPGQEKRKG